MTTVTSSAKDTWKPVTVGIGSSLALCSRMGTNKRPPPPPPNQQNSTPSYLKLERGEKFQKTKISGTKSAAPYMWRVPEGPVTNDFCSLQLPNTADQGKTLSESLGRGKTLSESFGKGRILYEPFGRPATVGGFTSPRTSEKSMQRLTTSPFPDDVKKQYQDYSECWSFQPELPSIYAPLGYEAFRPSLIKKQIPKLNLAHSQSYLSHINQLISEKYFQDSKTNQSSTIKDSSGDSSGDEDDDDEDEEDDEKADGNNGFVTTLLPSIVSIGMAFQESFRNQQVA